MKHAFLHLLVCVFFFSGSLFIVSPAFAVTIYIDQAPSTISADPFTVNASVTGAAPGTNYLRVDLYKDGTTSYFGETFNGTDWYSDSEGTNYFPITIDDIKNWQGSLQARIGTPSIHDYDGTGNYKLRIRRYTSSGNSATTEEANNSAVAIAIAYPTLTFTPAPTSTPTKVPTSTSTPKPTATTKPTPTNKPFVTTKPVLTSTKTPIPTNKPTTVIALAATVKPTTLAARGSDDIDTNPTDDVLGASTEGTVLHLLSPTPIESTPVKKETLIAGADQKGNGDNFTLFAFIGWGDFFAG